MKVLIVLLLLISIQPVRAQDHGNCQKALEETIGDRNISLDFRSLSGPTEQITINADLYRPTASSFKAFVVLYYFLNMPTDAPFEEGTPVYSMAVYSNNVKTGQVLMDVARQNNWQNPITAFNDFLLSIGMVEGLHDWDYPGSPTMGWHDNRFGLNQDRAVVANGRHAIYYNVTTATDIANGYQYLATAEANPLWQDQAFRQAISQTRDLLAIRAEGFPSPAEGVLGEFSFYGKDGALPSNNSSLGRVLNEGMVITYDNHTYIMSVMSVAQSELDLNRVFEAISDCIKA